MDRKEATISVEGLDKESALSVCFSIFQQFSWKPLQAGENKLLAVTPPEWNKKPQHITVTATDGLLTVSSEFAGEELMDVVGRNSRNVDQFLAAFQATKNSLATHKHQNNIQAISSLRAQAPMPLKLYKVQEQQVLETAGVKEVLNNASSNLYATYTLIALNIVVFFLMALSGAGILLSDGQVHLRWGSNYGPLTMGGDWWRLFTSLFIHFGLLHLALNMYCLYWAGAYIEPLVGRARFITAYLCTGVLSGIVSIWWHHPPVSSAGAAGAVWGIYGLLFVFLGAGLLPASLAQRLRRSIVFFIMLNLAIGLIWNMEIAAPLGGLLSGSLIGCLFVLDIRKEKQGPKAAWILPLSIGCTLLATMFFLQTFRFPKGQPIVAHKKATVFKYADAEKFNSAYQQFNTLGEKGLDVYNDNTITEAQRVTDLKSVSFTEWDSAEDIAREMKGYQVSPQMKQLAVTLEQYAQLRKEEIALYAEMVDKHTGPQKLDAIRSKMKTITDSLK